MRNYINSGAGAPGCLEDLPGVTDQSGLLNFISIKTKSEAESELERERLSSTP